MKKPIIEKLYHWSFWPETFSRLFEPWLAFLIQNSVIYCEYIFLKTFSVILWRSDSEACLWSYSLWYISTHCGTTVQAEWYCDERETQFYCWLEVRLCIILQTFQNKAAIPEVLSATVSSTTIYKKNHNRTQKQKNTEQLDVWNKIYICDTRFYLQGQ